MGDVRPDIPLHGYQFDVWYVNWYLGMTPQSAPSLSKVGTCLPRFLYLEGQQSPRSSQPSMASQRADDELFVLRYLCKLTSVNSRGSGKASHLNGFCSPRCLTEASSDFCRLRKFTLSASCTFMDGWTSCGERPRPRPCP